MTMLRTRSTTIPRLRRYGDNCGKIKDYSALYRLGKRAVINIWNRWFQESLLQPLQSLGLATRRSEPERSTVVVHLVHYGRLRTGFC